MIKTQNRLQIVKNGAIKQVYMRINSVYSFDAEFKQTLLKSSAKCYLCGMKKENSNCNSHEYVKLTFGRVIIKVCSDCYATTAPIDIYNEYMTCPPSFWSKLMFWQ